MARKTDLISYCGSYCGECPCYTHSIANLAKDLRGEFRRHKFAQFAPVLAKIPEFKTFNHYDKAYEFLGTISKMRCKDACKAGGGGASCPIRKCAKKKHVPGCWKCDDFLACKTLKVLEKYGDTGRLHLKNLRKIKRIGPAAFARQKAV